MPSDYSTSEIVGLTNSVIVKTSPARLFMITGYNHKTSDQFIQVHNGITVPSDGVSPKRSYIAKASSNFSISLLDPGLYCDTGLVVMNSTTSETRTAGDNDCQFYIDYI